MSMGYTTTEKAKSYNTQIILQVYLLFSILPP